MRKLNAPKLCNGIRLKVLSLNNNVIEAKILTGAENGQFGYILRIPTITNQYPYEFKRVQFPINLGFAI